MASAVSAQPARRASGWAPRARACPADSRTTTPAPSPRTKPSRSAARGREAPAGSSLRVDSARMAAKAATVIGCSAASVPPARTMSARPREMRSAPWAIASAPEAQAATGEWMPARAPSSMPTATAGELGMRAGTAVGATLRGPRSRSASQASMTESTGPMPGAMDTASRSPSTSGEPAWAQASREAMSASWLDLSSRRCSLGERTSAGSTARGAAMRTGRPISSAHSWPIGRTAHSPERRASQVPATSPPSGVVAPRPVMTTSLSASWPGGRPAWRRGSSPGTGIRPCAPRRGRRGRPRSAAWG